MKDYKAETDSLRKRARHFLAVAEKAGTEHAAGLFRKYLQVLENDKFMITVLGEFNRGKSTMVNALLGQDIIPTAIRPTTAALHFIRYGQKPAIQVHKADHSVLELPWDRNALKEYTALKDFAPESVNYIELSYPLEYLKDGTVLVDTPGVNDICQQRMDITCKYVPLSDAVIFLLDAAQPLSRSEQEFLQDYVLKSSLSSFVFVINQRDRIAPDGLETVVAKVRSQLEALLGQQEITVFAISARDGLQAKKNGDGNLLISSGFQAWEEQLKKFIIGDRKQQLKVENLQKQLQDLQELLLDEISLARERSHVDWHKIGEALDNITGIRADYETRFAGLLGDLDGCFRHWQEYIHDSLQKSRQDFMEEMNIKIKCDHSTRDFTEFAEVELPFMIKCRLKEWLEFRQDSIAQLVNGDLQHIANTYCQSFGEREILFDLCGRFCDESQLHSSRIHIHGGQNIQQVDKISRMAGAALFGLAAFASGYPLIAAPGLAFLGQSLGGTLVDYQVIRGKVKEQKKELQAAIADVLDKRYGEVEDRAAASLEVLVQSMKDTLQEDFRQVWDSIEADIQRQQLQKQTSAAALESKLLLLDACREDILQK